ncbi:MAG TPA: tRNA 2-thiouridine(34) synthase MnmA [Acidimicrobiales bacterium]|jgi:tRNA-specific 2-thiouridylase|nr:tRNA 2-thiouridine(34) synthase MnmA [Acidimicrobiales bacterium]
MRVLVAMSGGVDSSVAAASLVEAGHEVVGATMKLWGGPSDAGCCSVADVEDARRVAEQLGIVHHVFNFGPDFDARVVGPYVAAHARGDTPNPCVECNRHIKFDRLLDRAAKLGFDAIATGHHARVCAGPRGTWRLLRGQDGAKDQSYVLSMLGQQQLARCVFPVGELTKAQVRARAAALGLRTAAKPDSQDVCFIAAEAGGRRGFLAERVALTPGRVVDAATGAQVGEVPAVQLVTVGQRRGLGVGREGRRRYALEVDVASATVVAGEEADLLVGGVDLAGLTWVGTPLPPGTPVAGQTGAHAPPRAATLARGGLTWATPERRVAPGQTVALYDGDEVLGAGIAR